MDAAIQEIPEIDRAVGKLGRAESPLDPAPISMFETVVTYKPEFGVDADGNRVRNWRDHIRAPRDIWEEIIKAAGAPGLTSAPMLMPINTRIIMLQSGMRAPMGIKVYGPDLETIESFGLELEGLLREVRGIRPETVFADRVVGKPYIEIDIDREAIGRYGLTIARVQDVVRSRGRSKAENDTRSGCVTCARSGTAWRRSAACSYPPPVGSRSPSSSSPRFGT
jgi:Cu(I)/Ag(I) efflux system membrane protein CusA/SilA